MPSQIPRPRSRHLLIAVLIVFGVAGLGTAALAAAPRAGGAQAAAPGSPIPAAAIPALSKTAASIAGRNGDANPTSVTAVTATHAKAALFLSGDRIQYDQDTTVYLVAMKGHFVSSIPVPAGQPTPTGTYLYIILNAKTLEMTDLTVGNSPRNSLSNLGPVTALEW